MSGVRREWHGAALIVVANWFANFLHFRNMGLYEDDWYFVGFPFAVNFRQWMVDCLWNQLSIPEASVGRPFQFLFSFTFAELGALANSLAVDYLIAFAASSGAALLMYQLLRRRFGRDTALVAALLFVVSPLHTLHQSLLGQFSFAAAFSLLFAGMLLYVRRRRGWSYLPAALALLTYESIFFLFLAAPLMRRGRMWQGRRLEWMVHLTLCGAVVAAYYGIRIVTAEARVSGLKPGRELLGLVLSTWLVYTASSFTTYYYGALRALRDGTAEGWSYAAVCAAAAGALVRRGVKAAPAESRRQPGLAAPQSGGPPTARRADYQSAAGYQPAPQKPHVNRWLAQLVRPAFIGLAFLALGYAVAYFVLMEPRPRLPFTDRMTRASIAASFGSSLLAAVLLAGLLRRYALRAGAAVAVGLMFLYAFVLQGDYVRDWAMQGNTVRQFMALAPDAAEDSILVLRFPSVDPGLAGQPAIGADQDGLDEVIKHIYDRSQKLPTLFIVVSDDWPKYLRKTADGYVEWTAPFFPGRWYPSTGRYRPGRFIVLDEQKRGQMVRKDGPVIVDGVDIVQREGPRTDLWMRLQKTPLWEKLLVR